MADGAAGDPMSNGISVLLANATYPSDPRYNTAFHEQLDFIEHTVPRDANGAISHRVDEVQLWADSVFMVPPVLAYYGALQTDLDEQYKYLNMAVTQIRVYRQGLRDDSSNGLWHHVMQGSWTDPKHWCEYFIRTRVFSMMTDCSISDRSRLGRRRYSPCLPDDCQVLFA